MTTDNFLLDAEKMFEQALHDAFTHGFALARNDGSCGGQGFHSIAQKRARESEGEFLEFLKRFSDADS